MGHYKTPITPIPTRGILTATKHRSSLKNRMNAKQIESEQSIQTQQNEQKDEDSSSDDENSNDLVITPKQCKTNNLQTQIDVSQTVKISNKTKKEKPSTVQNHQKKDRKRRYAQ